MRLETIEINDLSAALAYYEQNAPITSDEFEILRMKLSGQAAREFEKISEGWDIVDHMEVLPLEPYR